MPSRSEVAPEVVVVVAAGPGLGLAVARRFAQEACSVGLVGRTAGTLAGLVAELAAVGPAPVATAVADVGDEESLRSALRSLAAELGDPTVLVYNGSAYVEGPVTSLSVAELRLALDAGVTGALVAVQETVPAMRLARRGTVLLTGSVAADRASTSAAAVGIAKAALRSLARSLHKEVAGGGVRVTTVTINGVLSGPKALDVTAIADRYWEIHAGPTEPEAETPFPS